MSAKPKDTLGGATKRDIALAVSIGFLILLGGVVILVLAEATYDIKFTGTIDVTLIFATFIGIIISVLMYLGFKQGQATVT